jgi:hypothetical protein
VWMASLCAARTARSKVSSSGSSCTVGVKLKGDNQNKYCSAMIHVKIKKIYF